MCGIFNFGLKTTKTFFFFKQKKVIYDPLHPDRLAVTRNSIQYSLFLGEQVTPRKIMRLAHLNCADMKIFRGLHFI